MNNAHRNTDVQICTYCSTDKPVEDFDWTSTRGQRRRKQVCRACCDNLRGVQQQNANRMRRQTRA